jgi:hypothetical protein
MADLWDDHDSYWRNTYSTRPYATGRTYDDLGEPVPGSGLGGRGVRSVA